MFSTKSLRSLRRFGKQGCAESFWHRSPSTKSVPWSLSDGDDGCDKPVVVATGQATLRVNSPCTRRRPVRKSQRILSSARVPAPQSEVCGSLAPITDSQRLRAVRMAGTPHPVVMPCTLVARVWFSRCVARRGQQTTPTSFVRGRSSAQATPSQSCVRCSTSTRLADIAERAERKKPSRGALGRRRGGAVTRPRGTAAALWLTAVAQLSDVRLAAVWSMRT